ncbi:MAG: DUF2179 domain-containing protein [Blautia sp.]
MNAQGGYNNEPVHIIMTIVSKYEGQILKTLLIA